MSSTGGTYYQAPRLRHSVLSLVWAIGLFLLTLLTSLIAGAHFAAAFAQNQAASFDTLLHTFRLALHHPASILAGLPFSLTLLTILLAHELGHYFACRHHHIHASYPYFIPAPTLIGTFGAFILIRSPIRSSRALFDVGASGPFVGFIFAVFALAYGVLHARVVPTLSADNADVIFGVPFIMKFVAAVIQPNAHASDLLLHPVGRAAWVGLFATAINLLPVGQLDGGHIVRSVSPRAHRWISWLLPLALFAYGAILISRVWMLWSVILFGLRFFRVAPIYDPTPLDPNRRFAAFLALVVFLLCFMPIPIQ